jgi:hypothetical protein
VGIEHEAVPAFANGGGNGPDDGPPPFDEAAESEFRAEARVRGETVSLPPAAVEAEADDAKGLPPLDSLVQQIPPEVREVLEELFLARFVRVQRVPKRALKTGAGNVA